jgi:hypothetical protein
LRFNSLGQSVLTLTNWKAVEDHRSQRYIQRYTNPPEAVAAAYVETF